MPSTWQEDVGSKRVDVYQEIPNEQREQLKQAVRKLVEAERARDWKSVYALLDEKPTETEDKFVSKMKPGRTLHEFQPFKVTFVPPDGVWNIEGCASFEGDQTGQGRVASVHARWGDSRWYLSPVVIDLFGTEKKMTPRPCLIAKEKSAKTTYGAAPTASSTPPCTTAPTSTRL
jgi:hypothetical protein